MKFSHGAREARETAVKSEARYNACSSRPRRGGGLADAPRSDSSH